MCLPGMVLEGDGGGVRGKEESVSSLSSLSPPPLALSCRDYLRALTWIVWDVDMGGVVPWLRPGRRPDRASELAAIIAERKGRSMVQ